MAAPANRLRAIRKPLSRDIGMSAAPAEMLARSRRQRLPLSSRIAATGRRGAALQFHPRPYLAWKCGSTFCPMISTTRSTLAASMPGQPARNMK